MSLILGLDAGGTYTDSVIFDSKTQKIISEGKSLTTNFDLSIGIKKSMDISLNKIPIKNQKQIKLIVVSSAMSGTTNDLIKKSKAISNNFSNSEYDVLVSSGEQISCSLIAGSLNAIGHKSRTWMGWQVPIFTEGKHKFSRISQIYKKGILKYLKSGGIP